MLVEPTVHETRRASDHQARALRVGIWGHNGTGNLGNEATVAAMIQILRSLDPGIEICGFSWDPVDTAARHGIPSFTIRRQRTVTSENGGMGSVSDDAKNSVGLRGRLRRFPRVYRLLKRAAAPISETVFLARSYRRLRSMDLMLAAGTGQICESFDGAWGYPYSLCKWGWLCRLAGVKWAIVSAGAGPIRPGLGRWLLTQGLRLAAYRSFRDQHSKQIVDRLNVGENIVYPDLVFGLTLREPCSEPHQTSRRVVITGLPYRHPEHWDRSDRDAYDRYLSVLRDFATRVLRRGYAIDLVPTDDPMDSFFNQELRAAVTDRCPGLGPAISILPRAEFDGVIAHYAQASLIVTTRFHGVVFGYMLGKPVLGVSVHRKISELMKDFGHQQFCIEADAVSREGLESAFDRLANAGPELTQAIKARTAFYRAELERQNRSLLRL